MMPPAMQSAWRRLIKGEIDHQFRVASASMLFFRLREQYKEEPARLDGLVREARAFFEKYEAILAQDIERLTR